MANEEELAKLQSYLEDADYKNFLSFCLEPREWKEIWKLDMQKSKIFRILKDLKMVKAIEFADGRYCTAVYPREYLK